MAALFLLQSCKNDPPPPPAPPAKSVKIPKFVQDSAYSYIEKQLSFGPRVPGTEAHQQTRVWLENKLHSFGATVYSQDFKAKHHTGKELKGTNIIGAYNPKATKRILLGAHWDSREYADYDPDPAKKKLAVPGADDGASGVAVLLEIARNLNLQKIDPSIGIDIFMIDLEDQGESKSEDINSWCLGAQHWSRNPHVSGYRAKYGILLDMVGSKGARFTKEEVSRTFAPGITNKLWALANKMGYNNYFVPDETRIVIDDHLFINRIAKIPMVDIINRPAESETGFGEYWHTHHDDISVIDKRTLKAVGQVVMAAIYNESIGKF